MDGALPSIDSIFCTALEIASHDKRSAYLDDACADNSDLRRRVDKLLEAHFKAGSFLGAPAPGLSTTMDQPAITERPGTVIGQYKLVEQIGDGGMGTVFMAEQTAPVKRRVALKVIKPGMDTAQVVARFEAERQALALMDHPNIAKVFDAGSTETGRPYFVMELVKGIPITNYCDEHQLTPRERLELFVPVCEAIQHAHHKGIIHRDLKPSNVLIASYDGRPVPKVIDFGVAKAMGQQLTERTICTGFGGIVGTLEYMSPEQAEFNALDIDTRSDIYSLGVLLYELLTGTTPLTKQRLQQTAIVELLRLIREEEPPRPSTRLTELRDSLPSRSARRKLDPVKLTKQIRGELDWIVMKSLEKDRTRRYDTAITLARDVERYLRDEAVEACPPSATYRLKKFLRKHRSLVATVAVLFITLSTAVIATTFGLVEAQRQRDVAAESRRVAEDARQAEAHERTVAEALAVAEAKAAKDAANALIEADQQRQNAIEEKLRAEQAESDAQAERDKAVNAEGRAKESADKATTEAAIATAAIEFIHADLFKAAPQPGIAPQSVTLQSVLDGAAKRIEEKKINDPLKEATIREIIADGYRASGDFQTALQHRERAHELRVARLGEENRDTLLAMFKLGVAYQDCNKDKQALDIYLKALAICNRMGDRAPTEAPAIIYVGMFRFKSDKKYTEAARLLEELIAIYEKWGLPAQAAAYRKELVTIQKLAEQKIPE